MKKVTNKLNPLAEPSTRTKELSARGKAMADAIPLDVDDDEDFVTQLARKLIGVAEVCSAGSSDDFTPRSTHAHNLILSNKRPSKVTKKLRAAVPKFTPYTFPHLREAKQLKEEILSKEFLHEYGK